ncbi:cytochrome P450 [Saccharopolyspora taberi]|uniref:Cytochrome P450 n=1 Tax=Saccharopolyspora taberi TaxID=60895 RepID=A0ABN3VLE1_9PSEU
MTVVDLDLTDPEVLRDPTAAYGRARELSPLARMSVPGMAPMWAVTRYEEARAMLADPRFELSEESFAFRPEVPEHCKAYLRTMQEMNGREHTRLRRRVAPAFTPRRAHQFRPRIERAVRRLLDALPGEPVELVEHFARPLPMDVICELVGIPESDRPQWRSHGAAVAAGHGQKLTEAVPAIIAGAEAAVAARRAEPADDLVTDLLRAEDQLDDTEIVTLIWNVVLAGQVPTNLIANAVAALLDHPDQLAALRADPGLMPSAVEELMRWCGPQLLTVPRFAREDVEIGGIPVPEGAMVTAVMASANRDPRVFDDPERLDLRRDAARHLGFAHGPHFCLGASLARVETEVALAGLLRRFPGLAAAGEAQRSPDPGTARLTALSVTGLG